MCVCVCVCVCTCMYVRNLAKVAKGDTVLSYFCNLPLYIFAPPSFTCSAPFMLFFGQNHTSQIQGTHTPLSLSS